MELAAAGISPASYGHLPMAGENLVEDDLNAPGPLSICYFLRFPGAVFLGTVSPSV